MRRTDCVARSANDDVRTSETRPVPIVLMRVNAKAPVGGVMTETVVDARTVPAAAVTVVVPSAIAVTTPSVVPTVAMARSADDHSMATFDARPVES